MVGGGGAVSTGLDPGTRNHDAPLSGQVALITGAGRGIGRAIAIRFAAAGAAVVCGARTDRDLQVTLEAVRSRGGEGLAEPSDVRDEAAMQALVDRGVERFSALHLAVLNAGINHPHTAVDALPPQAWSECVETNLTGVYLGLRAVVPHLRAAGGGRVLVLGSGAGRRPHAGAAAYSATKAAVSALVKVAADDLRSDGIAVNELLPGPTATAMHGVTEPDPDAADADVVPEKRFEGPLAGEWFKSPRVVAEFALQLMTLPAPGPTGQTFSLNRLS